MRKKTEKKINSMIWRAIRRNNLSLPDREDHLIYYETEEKEIICRHTGCSPYHSLEREKEYISMKELLSLLLKHLNLEIVPGKEILSELKEKEKTKSGKQKHLSDKRALERVKSI